MAQLNVEKIGKTKREMLARLLEKHGIDCLAVTEHHIPTSDYVQDKYSCQLNLPALKIKGYNSASKHRDKSSGGVAWYWKKDLNVEAWEGANLTGDLLEAGRDRLWIKIHCKFSKIALGAVYMPVENPSHPSQRYQEVLDILGLDCNLLEVDKVEDFIFGDFNAHVGSSEEHPLGIPGNKPKLGFNGQRLLLWCQSRGKILVNSQPNTRGIWTYVSNSGKCMSALDFLVCNESMLPMVEEHIIDDEREITSQINTDHNISLSVLNADYQRVEWKKTESRPKWDMENIDKDKFDETLYTRLLELEASRKAEGRENSPARIASDVTDALNLALKSSTKYVSHSARKKRTSREVLDIINKIKEA